MEVIAEEFDFSNIIGISEDQLIQHYQLYLGYISLRKKVLADLQNNNLSNYSYRGLKDGETYSLNGIVLHELYFSNLGQCQVRATDKLLNMIKRDFGSYNNWYDNFFKTASVSRGWTVLAYDFRDESLHNIMQDSHNQGPLWYGCPLLVIDVYEHAYIIDFWIDKKKYLNIIKKNINWKVVNKRFNRLFPYQYSKGGLNRLFFTLSYLEKINYKNDIYDSLNLLFYSFYLYHQESFQ